MANSAIRDSNERKYIRHPSDVPIEYCFSDKPFCQLDTMNNISLGGLSFRTECFIAPQSWLHLHIPIHEEHLEIDAQVRWCEERNDKGYDVGVNFSDPEQAFSVRMVEQICHIEHYKKQVKRNEGRVLNGDEAATEWIEKFANQFP